MAANPIYIETEEEIPEVIERVRRTSAEDVPLVLPTRSRFGQSRFNFQLLREYTAQMGKRVSIVSPDPAVQQMAEESGFRAFRAVWNFAAERDPSLPANPVRRLRRAWFPERRRTGIVRSDQLPAFYKAVCELPSTRTNGWFCRLWAKRDRSRAGKPFGIVARTLKGKGIQIDIVRLDRVTKRVTRPSP